MIDERSSSSIIRKTISEPLAVVLFNIKKAFILSNLLRLPCILLFNC